jgi:hypothetical protein
MLRKARSSCDGRSIQKKEAAVHGSGVKWKKGTGSGEMTTASFHATSRRQRPHTGGGGGGGGGRGAGGFFLPISCLSFLLSCPSTGQNRTLL